MKFSFSTLIAALSLLLIANLVQAQEEGMYRIKPADQLNIYVHQNADLTMTAPVLPDGTISYPLVGNLYVEGLTTAGLQEALAEKLKQFLQNPVVVVTIQSQTLYKVYVMGEVSSPGAYPYEEGKRLTDYLTLAGGTTPEANLKKCNIYARDSSSPRRVINLKEIFEESNLTFDIPLEPNDTVILERRSGFLVTNWGDVAQIFSIVLGIATLYLIIALERR